METENPFCAMGVTKLHVELNIQYHYDLIDFEIKLQQEILSSKSIIKCLKIIIETSVVVVKLIIFQL